MEEEEEAEALHCAKVNGPPPLFMKEEAAAHTRFSRKAFFWPVKLIGHRRKDPMKRNIFFPENYRERQYACLQKKWRTKLRVTGAGGQPTRNLMSRCLDCIQLRAPPTVFPSYPAKVQLLSFLLLSAPSPPPVPTPCITSSCWTHFVFPYQHGAIVVGIGFFAIGNVKTQFPPLIRVFKKRRQFMLNVFACLHVGFRDFP